MRGYDDSKGADGRTAGYERLAVVGRRGFLLQYSGRTASLATGRVLRQISSVLPKASPRILALHLALAPRMSLMTE